MQVYALPYPGTIYMFYSSEHTPDYDIIDALSSLTPDIPDIILYEVPSSDIDDILHWLYVNSNYANSGYLDRAIDYGDFVLTYGPNPNSEYEFTARQWLQDYQLLDYEVEWLNENFRLPHDVYITAEECGEENAFYYPYSKEVVICYEFVDGLYDLYLHNNEGDYDGADNFTHDVTIETLYHEIGHAIIDVYGLPHTGLEENVADQFAALILIRTYDPETGHTIGQDMLYNVGNYYLWTEQREDGPPAYWDTHGTNLQRFYNISCWAYGSNPSYNQDLIDDGWLPEDRSVWCEDEYWKIEQAFSHLLSYYTNGFFD